MNPNIAKANGRNLPSGDPYVYVTYELHSAFGYVAVIDPIEDRIIRRIAVGANPGPMCMDPAEEKLYVLNTGSASVTIIDMNNFKVITTVSVGSAGSMVTDPVAIFAEPYGKKVYVANYGDKNVTIIDSLTNKVIKHVGVDIDARRAGKPFAFASNANSDYVYVACRLADKKDYVVAISIEDDTIHPYGNGMELTFDMEHNPLVIHPDGHTQVTLGPTGILSYFDNNEIGLSKTSSLLDNTISGVYLDNRLLFCTSHERKGYLKRFNNLAINSKGDITYNSFADVPSYKAQDKIRVSQTQGFIGVTIQPTDFPTGGLQIYQVNGASSRFVELPYVGDLAFFSDTKAYVGELSGIRPIDIATASALPAIPIGSNTAHITVKNIISGYSNQSL